MHWGFHCSKFDKLKVIRLLLVPSLKTPDMERPTQLDTEYINRNVDLPYDLKVDEVIKAVSETYRLFNGLNNFLTTSGFSTA